MFISWTEGQYVPKRYWPISRCAGSVGENGSGCVGDTYPRLFFARVANTGLTLDVVCKSGRCRT